MIVTRTIRKRNLEIINATARLLFHVIVNATSDVAFNFSINHFEKLKGILGGDEEKYNMVLDYYDSCIKEELEYAFEDKGSEFEEWVDFFEECVNNGEINLNISGRDFIKMIEESMSQIIREIFCS